MSLLTPPSVTIRYKTDHDDAPTSKVILSTTPLTSEQLPVLSDSIYDFLGWVHINEAGHESALSERMIVSADWLIPTEIKNEYLVVFTAKWRKKSKKSGSGIPYDGDYVVTPKVVEQILPTAEKLMEEDVTVKSIPIYDTSNNSGGRTIYIGTEI